MNAGTTAAAGAAHAVAEALRASGAIIRVEEEDFANILRKNEAPLVVAAEGWMFGKTFDYITNYKGFFFFTRSRSPIQLPTRAEVVNAKKIWIPGA